MAWWGKLLGGTFGFMLGGPLGAALGAALGHGVDRGVATHGQEPLEPGERERIQTAFFTATFSVLGHLAKVDGRVSEEEIGLVNTLMDQMELPPDMRRTAIGLFTEGKAADFPLDEALEQFRQECHRRKSLTRMFLEIQIQGAYADGLLNQEEERLLLHIAERLHISRTMFLALARMARAQWEFISATGPGQHRAAGQAGRPGLSSAFEVLGVGAEVSDAEVKKAYRRLINQHHPDKLVSKGLPEEMMKLAAQKTNEIKQAYDAIKQARGMR